MSFLKKIFHANSPKKITVSRDNFNGICTPHCDYGTVHVGTGTYGRPFVVNSHPQDHVIIGKFCSIAAGVKIFGGAEHRSDLVSTYPFRTIINNDGINYDATSKGQTVVGNDVWIGTDAIILSGITIGDGAIIGAGALVTKNIEPYTIVGGNPAKLIRKRFSDEIIADLLLIKWWEWDPTKIIETADDFYLPMEEFIQKHLRQTKQI